MQTTSSLKNLAIKLLQHILSHKRIFDLYDAYDCKQTICSEENTDHSLTNKAQMFMA